MARLYFFLFLLVTFSLAFSQEKIKSLGKAEILVVTRDDNSVLVNEKTIVIYNSGYEEIYRKELPKNTIKLLSYNYDFQNDALYLETKATAGESVTSIFIKFDLKNQDYSIIKEQSYIRSVKDVAYSPDYYYKYIIDGKAVSIYTTDNSTSKPIYQGELTTRIETVDLDPFQSDQLLIGDKMTLRLVNMQNDRFLPIDISSFEKAMVIKPYTFLILSRGDLLFYNTQNFRENRTLISGIEDFKLNSDRTSIYIMLDNGNVEVWKLDASDFSAPMLTAAVMSDKILEIINQLNQEETEIYQSNKERIDRELEIKSSYFNPKGEFEKTADYESRLNEGKKYFRSIIDYYLGIKRAKADFEKSIVKLREQFYDSIKLADDERNKLVLSEMVKNSYRENLTNIESIGTYNADREAFPVTIDGKQVLLRVPIDKAPEFKNSYSNCKVILSKQLDANAENERILYYTAVSDDGEVYESLDGNEALYVSIKTKDRMLRNIIDESTKPAEPIVQTASNSLNESIVKTIASKKYYGLIIGVNDYASETVVDLDNPVQDAKALQKVLKTKYGFTDETTTLLENPTRGQIIEAFDKLSTEITEDDNLLVFYAGHGIWDKTLQQGYWLPSDAKATSKAAWLSNSTIRDYIGGIKSKHSLLIADACFSGGIFKTREVFVDDAMGFAQLYKLPSRKAMTSGNMKPVQDQSVFMKYFIDRLENNEYPLISAEQLFISIKVPVANNSYNGQVPQYGDIMNAGDEGGDFIFSLQKR